MINFVMFCLKESYDFLERYKKSQEEARQNEKVPAETVESGSLSLSQNLILGTSCKIFLTFQPTTNFHAKRRYSNVPTPSMVLIESVIIAGVETVHTQDMEDEYTYNGGVEVNTMSVTPKESIEVLGEYTGYVPPGYGKGEIFHYVMMFIGHIRKET
jgi:hypothetical protein